MRNSGRAALARAEPVLRGRVAELTELIHSLNKLHWNFEWNWTATLRIDRFQVLPRFQPWFQRNILILLVSSGGSAHCVRVEPQAVARVSWNGSTGSLRAANDAYDQQRKSSRRRRSGPIEGPCLPIREDSEDLTARLARTANYPAGTRLSAIRYNYQTSLPDWG